MLVALWVSPGAGAQWSGPRVRGQVGGWGGGVTSTQVSHGHVSLTLWRYSMHETWPRKGLKGTWTSAPTWTVEKGEGQRDTEPVRGRTGVQPRAEVKLAQ